MATDGSSGRESPGAQMAAVEKLAGRLIGAIESYPVFISFSAELALADPSSDEKEDDLAAMRELAAINGADLLRALLIVEQDEEWNDSTVNMDVQMVASAYIVFSNLASIEELRETPVLFGIEDLPAVVSSGTMEWLSRLTGQELNWNPAFAEEGGEPASASDSAT
jgi:hypothetical protein